MAACIFFGHRDCPDEVSDALKQALKDLIEKQSADIFYVGNNGNFDRMVYSALVSAKDVYPYIRYAVVLAYMPTGHPSAAKYSFSETLFPENLETVPKRFAILERNKWLLKHSDYVVTYVNYPWGGAFEFSKQAERMGKPLIRLGSL